MSAASATERPILKISELRAYGIKRSSAGGPHAVPPLSLAIAIT
jgi:hypothetical protein